jgi:hypothetical protein
MAGFLCLALPSISSSHDLPKPLPMARAHLPARASGYLQLAGARPARPNPLQTPSMARYLLQPSRPSLRVFAVGLAVPAPLGAPQLAVASHGDTAPPVRLSARSSLGALLCSPQSQPQPSSFPVRNLLQPWRLVEVAPTRAPASLFSVPSAASCGPRPAPVPRAPARI